MKTKILLLGFYLTPFLLSAQGKEAPLDSTKNKWSYSMSGYYYFVPEDANNFLPIFTADHKSLHLEGRYNYEDINTASAFAGWRLETGSSLQFAATPMVGFAFGNTNGFVPALELELSYKNFDIYTESEYLVDFSSKENNFVYTYSEAAITFFKEHVRAGFSGQRTRLYESAKEYAPGMFGEYYFLDRFSVGFFYYNPFSSSNYAAISFSVDF